MILLVGPSLDSHICGRIEVQMQGDLYATAVEIKGVQGFLPGISDR